MCLLMKSITLIRFTAASLGLTTTAAYHARPSLNRIPWQGFSFVRASLSRMSSVSNQRQDPFPVGTELHGKSGKRYQIEEILADRRQPPIAVYRASSDQEKFIIKNAIEGDFEYQKELQAPLVNHPNLRTIVDTVPDFELFIYPFMTGDLLRLSAKSLSGHQRKAILRHALTGLAALHDKNIIHSDIKPNNILINYEETSNGEFDIHEVKVSDLEDAVLLEPGFGLKGCLCGNQFWRSPESWARAKQCISSDIFSFGVVAIYVVLKEMVLFTSNATNENEAWQFILQKHISIFGTDDDSVRGLFRLIGVDNPWIQRFLEVVDAMAEQPRTPVSHWMDVDEQFRDLIVQMTNLDPARRITARDALAHPWFQRD